MAATHKGFFWGLAAAALMLGISQRQAITETVQNMVIPRGIRNNNPGNIRNNGTRWQGMALVQDDPSFVRFISPEYGIRALSHLLDTYATKYNLHTVQAIIERYAPGTENDTASYVQAVAGALGVAAGQQIDVQARKGDLIFAICMHENGKVPYSIAQIENGIMMA
jgi:hypothetical protein